MVTIPPDTQFPQGACCPAGDNAPGRFFGNAAFYIGGLQINDKFGIIYMPFSPFNRLLGINYDLGTAATGSPIGLSLVDEADNESAFFEIPAGSKYGFVPLAEVVNLPGWKAYQWVLTTLGVTVNGSRLCITPVFI